MGVELDRPAPAEGRRPNKLPCAASANTLSRPTSGLAFRLPTAPLNEKPSMSSVCCNNFSYLQLPTLPLPHTTSPSGREPRRLPRLARSISQRDRCPQPSLSPEPAGEGARGCTSPSSSAAASPSPSPGTSPAPASNMQIVSQLDATRARLARPDHSPCGSRPTCRARTASSPTQCALQMTGTSANRRS